MSPPGASTLMTSAPHLGEQLCAVRPRERRGEVQYADAAKWAGATTHRGSPETIGLLGLVSQAASPLRPIDHIWTPRSISTAALHGTPG